MRPVLLLLAKTAIAAPAHADMQAIARAAGQALPDWTVTWAFSEQGQPGLRARLDDHADAAHIRILPLGLPAEPATTNAILRAVQRWARHHRGNTAPHVDVAPGLSTQLPLLTQAIRNLALADPARMAPLSPLARDAALVPDHAVRVLVCAGGPCMDAGAASLWQHLRHRQDSEKLRAHGAGMMSCRTSCLGPCALGPVLQVWPEGSYYCGVDRQDLDRIIDSHLRDRVPVADLIYRPDGRKQVLRDPSAGGADPSLPRATD